MHYGSILWGHRVCHRDLGHVKLVVWWDGRLRHISFVLVCKPRVPDAGFRYRFRVSCVCGSGSKSWVPSPSRDFRVYRVRGGGFSIAGFGLISGCGIRFLVSGFWIPGFVSRPSILGFGFQVPGPGFVFPEDSRSQGAHPECSSSASGCWVSGPGCQVSGSGSHTESCFLFRGEF